MRITHKGEKQMKTEIIVAIIAGCGTVLAAVIGGVFAIITKKSNSKPEQKIQGNGNIQAGKDVNISGGVNINVETNHKRK